MSVDISATCDDPDYKPNEVVSEVFDPVLLTGEPDDKGVWQLSGQAKVFPKAPNGEWAASFMCGATRVVAILEVSSPEPPVVKPEIHVNPAKGVPGAKTELLMLCGANSGEVTATSKALTIGKLEPVPQKPGDVVPWLRATGTVQDVKPGDYPVTMTCGGKEFTTSFTVLAKGAPAPAPKAQVPVKPKGAADTGSLDAVPAPADDTNLYVLGGAALAALGVAGGFGAWAGYRKRQRT